MNILPKKSWHVLNEKNRERVAKDEAKAREEQLKEERRALQAERERRLALLRNNARERTEGSAGDSRKRPAEDSEESLKEEDTSGLFTNTGHVNFWAEMESGKNLGKTTNAEHDAEERAAKEKEERKTTMYLDSAKEAAPWYAGSSGNRNQNGDEAPKRRKQEGALRREDPMKEIARQTAKVRPRPDAALANGSKAPKTYSSKDGKAPDFAKLRLERLQRESSERARLHNLASSKADDKPTDERYIAYNGTFNPTFKKPRR
ncbi:hypothetical protein M427DRAFT_132583 [Gonapodya prolifera JEL478]|uniref:CBF1-interacting co-repressor CIR N-terminal domain-containing protein n=1 Tax=Gonapodya prolifera (strain JEL478) TaxID=1344416 RepID=A0A139APF6_GONPJ|nr:hypothetical protein M427DRAFT_132583 [Gonapodya prolifera JEL478]|eukprot:KXS18641.1 hypothetical protein M427DRAFT_132583 [Gonapodya prolifera JEL478]